MRRGRPPRSPPGLGSIPNGENPTSEPEISPFDGDEHIPWSGRGSPIEEGAQELAGDITNSEEALKADVLSYGSGPELLPARLEALWAEFLDQNAVVEQLGGQLRAMEQAAARFAAVLDEHRNAVLTIHQRLDALAKQTLQTNTRMAALQLAVQGKSERDTPEKLVAQAERFYQFLLRDVIPHAKPIEIQPSLDLDQTTH